MISIKVDNSQIQTFFKRAPKKADWAMKEALSMAGGHFGTKVGGEDSLREFICRGVPGIAPLHPLSEKMRDGKNKGRPPLWYLGNIVSFRYGKTGGRQRVFIGWLGKGQPKFARRMLYGKRVRVTEAKRQYLHKKGLHLKKGTKFLQIPARPVLDIFWSKKSKQIPGYVETKFFEKFFSK